MSMSRPTFEAKKQNILDIIAIEELSTSEISFRAGYNYYNTEAALKSLEVQGKVTMIPKERGVFWRKK